MLIALTLLMYRVLTLTFQRTFDTDEFEHVQAAWLLSQGFSIYHDFFEHHPPLLYFLLSPLLVFFHETGKLFAARAMMLPFAMGILAMIYLLASRIRGKLAGAMACALLSTVVVFQQKSIEIRPDVPGLFFLLLAIYCGLAAEAGPLRSAGAGAAYGLALLCTPKLMFALPAFPLMMIGPGPKRRLRWSAGGWIVLGLLLPFALVAVFLYWRDSLQQAIFFNLNFNLAIPFTFRRKLLHETLGQSLADNWCFWFLAFFALGVSMARPIREARIHNSRRRNELIITVASLGLVIGFFTLQVPQRQYLMSVCALLSILAGTWGATMAQRLRKLRWSAVSSAVLMLLLTAIMLHPACALLKDRLDSNQKQLRVLRHVWTTVPAGESMFDCWTGHAVFRRPVFFYHFLGLDIIGALERLDPNILRTTLPKILAEKRPFAVVHDPALAALPDGPLRYIEAHYFLDRCGILYLRKVSTDERPESR